MARRLAPEFCFLLLWIAAANCVSPHAGGQAKQLPDPLLKSTITKSHNGVKRSISDGDKKGIITG